MVSERHFVEYSFVATKRVRLMMRGNEQCVARRAYHFGTNSCNEKHGCLGLQILFEADPGHKVPADERKKKLSYITILSAYASSRFLKERFRQHEVYRRLAKLVEYNKYPCPNWCRTSSGEECFEPRCA